MAKPEEQKGREVAKGLERAGSGSQELREQFDESKRFEEEARAEYKRIMDMKPEQRKGITERRENYDRFNSNSVTGRKLEDQRLMSPYDVPAYLLEVKKEAESRATGTPEEIQDKKDKANREYLHKSIGFARAAFEAGNRNAAVSILDETNALDDKATAKWFSDELLKLSVSENPEDFNQARTLRRNFRYLKGNQFAGLLQNRIQEELSRLTKVAQAERDIVVPENTAAIAKFEEDLYKKEEALRNENLRVSVLEKELDSNQDGALANIFKSVSGGRTRSRIEKELDGSRSKVGRLSSEIGDLEAKIAQSKKTIEKVQSKLTNLYTRQP